MLLFSINKREVLSKILRHTKVYLKPIFGYNVKQQEISLTIQIVNKQFGTKMLYCQLKFPDTKPLRTAMDVLEQRSQM